MLFLKSQERTISAVEPMPLRCGVGGWEEEGRFSSQFDVAGVPTILLIFVFIKLLKKECTHFPPSCKKKKKIPLFNILLSSIFLFFLKKGFLSQRQIFCFVLSLHRGFAIKKGGGC